MLASSDLIAYWRLGEAAAPFADTSGAHPGTEADCVAVTRSAAYTTDVTGALPAPYDDGAIQFNGSAGLNDYINSTNSSGGRFNAQNALAAFSVACFIKVNANAATFTAAIVNYQYSTPATGWALNLYYPARLLTWERQDVGQPLYFCSTTGIATGAYLHVCGVFEAPDIMILYVDGVEVDRLTGVYSGLPGWNSPVNIGGADPNASAHYRFDGEIDEVALWDATLTPTFIAELAAMRA